MWDPTKPVTNAPLLSAPIRENFQALSALMQGAGGTAAWPLRAPDGTAAAPSYSFASAPDVGLSLIADWGGPGDEGVRLSDGLGGMFDVGSYGDFVAFGLSRGSASFFLEASEDIAEIYLGVGPASELRYTIGGSPGWAMSKTSWFPRLDALQDLGDATHQIRDLYLSGQVLINGVPLTGGGGIAWPLLAPDGSAASPVYSFTGGTGTGLYRVGGSIGVASNGGEDIVFNYNVHGEINLISSGRLTWSSSATSALLTDLILARDGPGILAQKNGANSQTLRIYRDATTYLALDGTSGITLPLHASAPATPAAGYVVLYAKADKKFYAKNDAGTETALY